MMMDDISGTTLADGVENSILSFIRDQTLQPGDMLPREEEIADHLKVSRLSVREGLGRLKALGLVEPRKRRGTVLRKPRPFHAFSKIARTNLFTGEERKDFMEIRVALELGMCELIYMRKTPEAIAKLRQIAEKGLDISDDVEFHSMLLAVSGNRNADEFRQLLVSFFDFPRKNHYELMEKSRNEHIALCDILEKGTAEEFRNAMREHFEPYFKYFQENADKEKK